LLSVSTISSHYMGTTSAGSTCGVREGNGNEFSAQAGALLVSVAFAALTNLAVYSGADRTTFMRLQTLSVVKAGTFAKLQAVTIAGSRIQKGLKPLRQPSVLVLATQLLARLYFRVLISSLMDTSMPRGIVM
jgi:hypothetical protein